MTYLPAAERRLGKDEIPGAEVRCDGVAGAATIRTSFILIPLIRWPWHEEKGCLNN